MANWSYTLLQLIQKISFAAGNFKIKIESLTNPDVETQFMIECVNEVIRKIWQAKATPWNLGEGQIQVKECLSTASTSPVSYAAATVTLTYGSATATVNKTAIGSDYLAWTNRALWLTDTTSNLGYVRVVSAANGTDVITLTCLGLWPYATVTTSANWKAPLDRYELASDFGDFVTAVAIPEDAMGASSATPSRTLKITDLSEMERLRYTMRTPNTLGNPNCITIAGKSTNKLWLAQLDPFPEDEGMVRYTYKKVPAVISADTDYIPVPDEIYDLLANGVLALWKQRTGVAGSEQAFEVWKKTDLTEYVTLGRKLTDNVARVWPADTMRSSGSPVI